MFNDTSQRILEGFLRDETLRGAMLGLVTPGDVPTMQQIHLLERYEHEEKLRKVMTGGHGFGGATDQVWAMAERIRREEEAQRRARLDPMLSNWAMQSAELARHVNLAGALSQFRTPEENLTAKYMLLGRADLYQQPAYLESFARASAVADFLEASTRVDRDLRAATNAFGLAPIPGMESVASYGRFLDAAGLWLPHYPSDELLRLAQRQRRRRLRERLKENAQPKRVAQATNLVHTYELTLRQCIDGAMSFAYGPEWASERLPRCSKDLFGKWRKRGGVALEHADFAHYVEIMCDPEHFDAVFYEGFDDLEELKILLLKARQYRVASHHPGKPFSKEDLQDLRVTFRLIERGLAALPEALDEDDD